MSEVLRLPKSTHPFQKMRRACLVVGVAIVVVAVAAVAGICGSGNCRAKSENTTNRFSNITIIDANGTSSQPPFVPMSSGTTSLPTRNPSESPMPIANDVSPTTRPIQATTVSPTTPGTEVLDGMQGALVTSDCKFQDYSYAIDVYWSCGSERFNEALRLHTFKRHSYNHHSVFNDQLITYRNSQLWFDNYNIPRCIRSDTLSGELQLDTATSGCSVYSFVPSPDQTISGYMLKDENSGSCLGLGEGVDCNSDHSTGGNECGGVDHRFLPLKMGNCISALQFHFETETIGCTNGAIEFPDNSCF